MSTPGTFEPGALLTPAETAELLHASPKTVTRWGDTGKLGKVVRTPGGHRRYGEAAVRAYLAFLQGDRDGRAT